MYSGRNGGGKPEDSLVGDIIVSGSSDVCPGGSGEVYPLVGSLGS